MRAACALLRRCRMATALDPGLNFADSGLSLNGSVHYDHSKAAEQPSGAAKDAKQSRRQARISGAA